MTISTILHDFLFVLVACVPDIVRPYLLQLLRCPCRSRHRESGNSLHLCRSDADHDKYYCMHLHYLVVKGLMIFVLQ